MTVPDPGTAVYCVTTHRVGLLRDLSRGVWNRQYALVQFANNGRLHWYRALSVRPATRAEVVAAGLYGVGMRIAEEDA